MDTQNVQLSRSTFEVEMYQAAATTAAYRAILIINENVVDINLPKTAATSTKRVLTKREIYSCPRCWGHDYRVFIISTAHTRIQRPSYNHDSPIKENQSRMLRRCDGM